MNEPMCRKCRKVAVWRAGQICKGCRSLEDQRVKDIVKKNKEQP